MSRDMPFPPRRNCAGATCPVARFGCSYGIANSTNSMPLAEPPIFPALH
ncbi:hypothetical protein BPA30113_02905 [Burkholderia paludis]|uniref:Uncharacterized protein n=1 Tax=Burkholderia paludis TaxID=1506587 RepID=A0A6P2L5S9_9BURK|nr:hypothetical protein LMG30113_01858 [Burkholderia paludis]VWB65106.1 hypothetical protein BPA30113_02905 [Burkholderia paludis]